MFINRNNFGQNDREYIVVKMEELIMKKDFEYKETMRGKKSIKK